MAFWNRKKGSNRVGNGQLVRVFDAAKTDELTQNWFMASIGVNQAIEQRLKLTRQRAQDFERNNAIIHRYINLLLVNVIGPNGFRLTNKSFDYVREGSTWKEQPDPIANDAIEMHWNRFARSVTPSGLSLKDLLRIAYQRRKIDGEHFILKTSGGPYGMQLVSVEAERLNYEYSDPANRIIHGTQFGDNGAIQGYYFKDVTFAQELHGYGYSSAVGNFVPASQVYYIGKKKFAEQVRALPEIHPVMYPLYQLSKYQEAEIVAAVTASAKQGFLVTQQGVDVQYSKSIERIGIDAKAGAIDQLPDGLTFQPWDPQHPTSQYSEFIRAKLREIASGLNVSYFQLASDLSGVNYTSSRTGLLEDRSYYESEQNDLIDSFLIPLFEDWLRDALALERITTSQGTPLPLSRYDKFNKPHFQGRRWPWVDPQKEINAHIMAINANLASPLDIISSGGADAWDVYKDLQLSKEWQQELGIYRDPETGQSQNEEQVDEME